MAAMVFWVLGGLRKVALIVAPCGRHIFQNGATDFKKLLRFLFPCIALQYKACLCKENQLSVFLCRYVREREYAYIIVAI